MITSNITAKEIHDRCAAIVVRMSAAGMTSAKVNFWICANERNTVYISANEETPHFWGDGIAPLRQAEEWAANLPSLEDRKKANFHAQLAETIRLGKELDLDVKHINPLEALAKKIASFILPAPKKSASDDGMDF